MELQRIMNIFSIHDDLFDKFIETDQNSDIVLNVINKDI